MQIEVDPNTLRILVACAKQYYDQNCGGMTFEHKQNIKNSINTMENIVERGEE
jgi:hypothetical protein